MKTVAEKNYLLVFFVTKDPFNSPEFIGADFSKEDPFYRPERTGADFSQSDSSADNFEM